MNVAKAHANLYKLIDDASASHEPVVITGKRGNAVLQADAIGMQLTRLCIFSLSKACVDPLSRACRKTLKRPLLS